MKIKNGLVIYQILTFIFFKLIIQKVMKIFMKLNFLRMN
jgi:hypothetical protein